MEYNRRAVFLLEGLTCSSCSRIVTNIVSRLEGVDADTVQVTLFPQQRLTLAYNSQVLELNEISSSVTDAGYSALMLKDEDVEGEDGPQTAMVSFSFPRNADIAKEGLAGIDGVIKVEDSGHQYASKTPPFCDSCCVRSVADDETSSETIVVHFDGTVVTRRELFQYLLSNSEVYGDFVVENTGG